MLAPLISRPVIAGNSEADLPDGGANHDPPRYIRALTVPAAAPWDQQRAALLNAELNSPLPNDQVLIQVKRLGSWRPNEQARFAAAYVKRADVSATTRFAQELDGIVVAFEFSTAASKSVARRRAILDLGLISSLLVVTLVAGAASLERRAETVAALAVAQRTDDQAIRRARLSSRITKNLRKLGAAGYAGRSGGDLLADLSWLARYRNSNSVLQSITWDRGNFVLRSIDPTPPLLSSVGIQTEAPDANGQVWQVSAPKIASRGAEGNRARTVSIAPISIAQDPTAPP